MAMTITDGMSTRYDELLESWSWGLFVEIAIKVADRSGITPELEAVYTGDSMDDVVRDQGHMEVRSTFFPMEDIRHD